MKRIKQFEAYRAKNNQQKVEESVFQVEDTYKVRTTIDVPKSFVNAYLKKVKEETGEDLSKTFGDFDIAEEIVKHVTTKYLDNDIVSSRALIGGEEEEKEETELDKVQPQEETQLSQVQPQEENQDEEDKELAEMQQGQEQDQNQDETQSDQTQPQDDDFEDVQNQEDQEEEDEDLPI